ncbi:MAG: hypothetical protein LBU14_05310 [Candidatus Peribacteria bacterium]|nr:hypothetical protein [Candidatus Peribacteria bacterium]
MAFLVILLFYKSEKSTGRGSLIEYQGSEFLQNILFQISSIFSNIFLGSAKLTSSHKNFQRVGNTNIAKTVTTIQITAYLIVFIAGFILSSFHQDNIKSNPHHNINIIENTDATKTNIEITSKIKSHASILLQKTEVVVHQAAYIVSITIKNYLV